LIATFYEVWRFSFCAANLWGQIQMSDFEEYKSIENKKGTVFKTSRDFVVEKSGIQT